MWRSVQVAVAVAVIVVPFGYAITGVHNYVLLGAGCGFAIGVGVSLRLGGRNGISTGILVGSFAGMAAPLLAAFIPGLDGPFIFAPPLVALTVGLVDGLGTSRLRGYREASLEALTVCALAGAGLLPALGPPAVTAFIIFPAVALVAGYFNCDSEGRRHSRPPAALMLGALAALALTFVGSLLEFGSSPSPSSRPRCGPRGSRSRGWRSYRSACSSRRARSRSGCSRGCRCTCSSSSICA